MLLITDIKEQQTTLLTILKFLRHVEEHINDYKDNTYEPIQEWFKGKYYKMMCDHQSLYSIRKMSLDHMSNDRLIVQLELQTARYMNLWLDEEPVLQYHPYSFSFASSESIQYLLFTILLNVFHFDECIHDWREYDNFLLNCPILVDFLAML